MKCIKIEDNIITVRDVNGDKTIFNLETNILFNGEQHILTSSLKAVIERLINTVLAMWNYNKIEGWYENPAFYS